MSELYLLVGTMLPTCATLQKHTHHETMSEPCSVAFSLG